MRSLPLVFLLLTLQAAAATSDPANVVFGYTDKTGTKLLALGSADDHPLSVADANTLTTAVCAEGKMFPIRYLQAQEGTPGGTNRQSAYNFEHESGPLFEIVKGQAEASDTCMLVPAQYTAAFPFSPNALSVAGRAALESTRWKAGIAKAKGRTLKQYWPLYQSGSEQEIAAVEFTPEGDSLLGGLVLVESGHLSFKDMPASLQKGLKDGGCWRVDDDCRFDVAAFKIQAVLGSPGKQLIFITMDGAEGTVILLLQAKDGALVELKRSYRYQSPV